MTLLLQAEQRLVADPRIRLFSYLVAEVLRVAAHGCFALNALFEVVIHRLTVPIFVRVSTRK